MGAAALMRRHQALPAAPQRAPAAQARPRSPPLPLALLLPMLPLRAALLLTPLVPSQQQALQWSTSPPPPPLALLPPQPPYLMLVMMMVVMILRHLRCCQREQLGVLPWLRRMPPGCCHARI